MALRVDVPKKGRRMYSVPTTDDPEEAAQVCYKMSKRLKGAIADAAERMNISATEFMIRAALEKLEKEGF
ncbi:MAG: hypothetical protein ACLP6G_19075 [Terriglobales bacterium]